MVVIVEALDDWTTRVTSAPQNAPRRGVAAALASTTRKAVPARAFMPPVMTVIPSRKRPTPPRIEIAVDTSALPLRQGLHISLFARAKRLFPRLLTQIPAGASPCFAIPAHRTDRDRSRIGPRLAKLQRKPEVRSDRGQPRDTRPLDHPRLATGPRFQRPDLTADQQCPWGLSPPSSGGKRSDSSVKTASPAARSRPRRSRNSQVRVSSRRVKVSYCIASVNTLGACATRSHRAREPESILPLRIDAAAKGMRCHVEEGAADENCRRADEAWGLREGA